MRVTLLTNILPPYRVDFLNQLADALDLSVVVNEITTPDRSWVIDRKALRFDLLVESGITRPIMRSGAANHSERRYVHLSNRVLPILNKTRPDVVISLELGLRTAQAVLFARHRRIPLILYWEGTSHTEARISSLRERWRRLLAGRADAVWVNGVEAADYVAKLGVPAEKIVTGMTGVDTRFFRDQAALLRPRREAARAELRLEGVVLAYSGALSPRKGIEHYLRALDSAGRSGILGEFSLLFIGDGELRGLVESWASAHPGVRVHVTGFQQLAKLPGYYVCADWFVLPTLEDCWALATVEPMACGLPQVFSKYNGASADLIQHPGAGVMVDPLDETAFGRTLADVVRTGARPLSEAVIERVTEHYSGAAQAKRAAESIDRVLAGRGPLKTRRARTGAD